MADGNTYYTTIGAMEKRYESAGRKMGFTAGTVREAKRWQIQLRSRLEILLGLDRMESCALQPEPVEICKLDGYTREKVVIQTEPGVRMPFYILSPDDLREGEKRPAVLALHGHGGAGKEAVAGRTDIPAVKNAIDRYNYAYGIQLVRAGYVVFCPDARGFGERREAWTQGDGEERLLGSSCAHLNNMAISMGLSLTGLWIWDLMRLMDYTADVAFVDPQRIACCGFSGGGLQTLWLTALDDRIKCAVLSGYFYGFRESLLMEPHCSCNYVPGLWEYADAGDLGALIAPRPLLVESGAEDRLNGISGLRNVTNQLNITRAAYTLFSNENRLCHYIVDGGHRWNGGKTAAFFNQYL